MLKIKLHFVILHTAVVEEAWNGYRALRVCNSLWQSMDKESVGALSYILHVDQPFPHSRGMGWHSYDVQTWHKSTSHGLRPPSLLDPWGRALRGGSSELDWGRMEWVDVSGLMRSKCTQRGNCNQHLHSYVRTCPLMQVRMRSEWIMAVMGPTNKSVAQHSQGTFGYPVITCVLCRNQTQHSHTQGDLADAPLTVLPVCIRISVVTQVQLLMNTAPTQIH